MQRQHHTQGGTPRAGHALPRRLRRSHSATPILDVRTCRRVDGRKGQSSLMCSNDRTPRCRRTWLLSSASTTVAAPSQVASASWVRRWAPRATASLDPVVDEQHAVTAVDEVLAEAEAEMPIPVVRGHGPPQPGITVTRGHPVFAHLDEPDAEVQHDQRAQEAPAGLRPEDDRGRSIREQPRQRSSQTREQVGSTPQPVTSA